MLLPAAIVHAVQARECEREANAEERKIDILWEWEARRGQREWEREQESESWLNTVRTIIVCTTNCEIYDNGQRREEQDVRTVRRAEIRAANEGKKGRGRGRSSHSRQPLMDVL